MNWTLKWNSSGTSNRKSSIRWTQEKAVKATAETIVGECHLEGFKSESGPARESKATQLRKSALHAERPRDNLPGQPRRVSHEMANPGWPGRLDRVVIRRCEARPCSYHVSPSSWAVSASIVGLP